MGSRHRVCTGEVDLGQGNRTVTAKTFVALPATRPLDPDLCGGVSKVWTPPWGPRAVSQSWAHLETFCSLLKVWSGRQPSSRQCPGTVLTLN